MSTAAAPKSAQKSDLRLVGSAQLPRVLKLSMRGRDLQAQVFAGAGSHDALSLAFAMADIETCRLSLDEQENRGSLIVGDALFSVSPTEYTEIRSIYEPLGLLVQA